jgi:hypothetical protein
MLDRVQLGQPAPRTRRLLLRLCLFAFCGGLLLLLSSRPADAAERREPRLLDPVRTTLKATAREVDSFAGRATGSGTSTLGKAATAAHRVATPRPRPATSAARPRATSAARPAAASVARPAPASTVKRGAPAVTSPVRRAAPSTRPTTSAVRPATRSTASAVRPAAGSAARSVTRASTRSLERAAKLAENPLGHAGEVAGAPLGRVGKVAGAPVGRVGEVAGGPLARTGEVAGGPLSRVAKALCGPVDGHGNLARRCATLPLRGAEPGPGALKGARLLGPVVGLTGPVLRPLGPALAPVGSALAPVGSVLAPVVGPVGGLVRPVVPGGLLPLPGLAGSGAGVSAGVGASASAGARDHGPGVGFAGFEGFPADVLSFSQTNPARPAADGASSPAARSIRSWPALTGAVSLPGSPASAELPAGGPDPLSSSSGAGLGLAALAAALVLLGPIGRGLARADGSGVISRSYLPLVSPA